MPCDVFIPAAKENSINANNVHMLQCKILGECAVLPTTARADGVLADRGVVCLSGPSFFKHQCAILLLSLFFSLPERKNNNCRFPSRDTQFVVPDLCTTVAADLIHYVEWLKGLTHIRYGRMVCAALFDLSMCTHTSTQSVCVCLSL